MAHPAILEWPVEPSDDLPLALWDAAGIAAATGGTAHGDFQASGVEIDSREVGEGDLFVALKGAAMDGHRFVAGALKQGAAGVLVSQPVDGPHVLVEDTQAALEAHLSWWDEVIRLRRAAGAQRMTLTPEFGPVPYTPTLPYTRAEISNAWELTVAMLALLRQRYA